MANLTTFLEPGFTATQNPLLWNVGTFSGGAGQIIGYGTQPVNNSNGAISASIGTLNGFAAVGASGVLADAGRRINCFIRYNGTPNNFVSGSVADFLSFQQNGNDNNCFSLGLTTGNTLAIIGAGGTQVVGSSSVVLAQNTDYRVSLTYNIVSSTSYNINAYLNGTSVITVANVGTLSFVTTDTMYFGWGAVNGPGTNMNLFGAHFFIDNGTAGDLGNINVTAKRTFSNGNINGYGSAGTASGYGSGNAQYVNNRPTNTTTSNVNKVGAGAAVTEEYNIEGSAVGDNAITGTIVDYMGWLYTKALVGETGQIIVNGGTSNISITGTASILSKIAGSTTYPAGTGADIGEITATTLTTVTLYGAGVIVAYIPAIIAGAAPAGMRSMLGVGQ